MRILGGRRKVRVAPLVEFLELLERKLGNVPRVAARIEKVGIVWVQRLVGRLRCGVIATALVTGSSRSRSRSRSRRLSSLGETVRPLSAHV